MEKATGGERHGKENVKPWRDCEMCRCNPGNSRNNIHILFQKLQELVNSGFLKSKNNRLLAKKALHVEQYESEGNRDEARKLKEKLSAILYPNSTW